MVVAVAVAVAYCVGVAQGTEWLLLLRLYSTGDRCVLCFLKKLAKLPRPRLAIDALACLLWSVGFWLTHHNSTWERRTDEWSRATACLGNLNSRKKTKERNWIRTWWPNVSVAPS